MSDPLLGAKTIEEARQAFARLQAAFEESYALTARLLQSEPDRRAHWIAEITQALTEAKTHGDQIANKLVECARTDLRLWRLLRVEKGRNQARVFKMEQMLKQAVGEDRV